MKLDVDVGSDFVRIYNESGVEIVGWQQQEWEEDKSVIISIFNAINLANKGKLDEFVAASRPLTITREQMKDWAETYDEAIDTLMWILNDDYTKEDMIASIEDYEEQFEDVEKVYE